MNFLNRFFSTGGEAAEAGPKGIFIVVGLGNPGEEYAGTRHNVGFDLVDRMVADRGWSWKRDSKMRAKVALGPGGICFAKPQTYMNLSGNAVARLGRAHRATPSQILVVYDDVALPPGKLRFRRSGSAGGHNGIKSIIEYLGTDEFPRLRIGVGSAGVESTMVDHVLGRFTDEERGEIEKILAIAKDGVNCALSSGLEAAMNSYN